MGAQLQTCVVSICGEGATATRPPATWDGEKRAQLQVAMQSQFDGETQAQFQVVTQPQFQEKAPAQLKIGDKHQDLDYGQDKSASGTLNFQCPHCCRKFDTSTALRQHDPCMSQPNLDVDGDASGLKFKSGDGTVEAVGVKLTGSCQCSLCNQKFDTEKALRLHEKFIHNQEASLNVGYSLVYEFSGRKDVDVS